MQVEAKLVIGDSASFEALMKGLYAGLGQPATIKRQRNVFLDGSNGELAAINAVCRVRTDCIGDQRPDQGQSSVVLKEHNEVEDGTSARFVVEADLPPGSAFADLRQVESAVEQTCVGEAIHNRFGSTISVRSVGSFDNVRTTFSWTVRPDSTPVRVNMDRTTYPFGEGFEVEVPCNDSVYVEEVLEGLRALVDSSGVAADNVSLGGRSKFQTYAEGMKNMMKASSSHMRVEAKLLLPDVHAYERVLARLIRSHIRTDVQRNLFFDSVGRELSAAGAYLRVRVIDGVKYTVTIKQHSNVVDGSGISWVQEEELPGDVADALIVNQDLRPLLQLRSSTVATALVQRFQLPAEASATMIGGFENRRSVFTWPEANPVQEGLQLRVDETSYAGSEDKRYEVEVADISVPVHDVIELLQSSLQTLEIESTLCESSKFAEMVARAQSGTA